MTPCHSSTQVTTAPGEAMLFLRLHSLWHHHSKVWRVTLCGDPGLWAGPLCPPQHFHTKVSFVALQKKPYIFPTVPPHGYGLGALTWPGDISYIICPPHLMIKTWRPECLGRNFPIKMSSTTHYLNSLATADTQIQTRIPGLPQTDAWSWDKPAPALWPGSPRALFLSDISH